MCRLCGRVVKCIFDTMPSRVYHAPSRRAFTTIRRLPTSPRTSFQSIQPRSSMPSLTRAFSALTCRPTSILSTTATRPSLTVPQSSITLQLPSQIQAFSSSATLGAKRDTYNPSRRVQKRRHGFLARIRSKTGQDVIKRRRLKGRATLTW